MRYLKQYNSPLLDNHYLCGPSQSELSRINQLTATCAPLRTHDCDTGPLTFRGTQSAYMAKISRSWKPLRGKNSYPMIVCRALAGRESPMRSYGSRAGTYIPFRSVLVEYDWELDVFTQRKPSAFQPSPSINVKFEILRNDDKHRRKATCLFQVDDKGCRLAWPHPISKLGYLVLSKSMGIDGLLLSQEWSHHVY